MMSSGIVKEDDSVRLKVMSIVIENSYGSAKVIMTFNLISIL